MVLKVRILLWFLSFVGFVVIYTFLSDFWWTFVGVGVLVFIGSVFIPKRKASTKNDKKEKKEELMNPPDHWDETEMTKFFTGFSGSSNVLSAALDRITDQFILGQKTEVAKKRIAYLETQLEFADLARKAYAWKMAIKNQLIDKEEELKVKRFNRQEELEEIEHQAKKEELLMRIEQAKKERGALNKPAPPEPKRVSEEERKQAKLKVIEERIERLKEEIRKTKADPTLDQDIKMTKLNALHDELAEAEAERVRLL